MFLFNLCRNSIILAHQCQITQLKDSFREKLRSAELSPEKLAEEVNKEREKHQENLRKLESELTQNFKMVLFVKEKFTMLYLTA